MINPIYLKCNEKNGLLGLVLPVVKHKAARVSPLAFAPKPEPDPWREMQRYGKKQMVVAQGRCVDEFLAQIRADMRKRRIFKPVVYLGDDGIADAQAIERHAYPCAAISNEPLGVGTEYLAAVRGTH